MSDDESLGAKALALAAILVVSGVYHYFATDKQQILNARVMHKHKTTRLVRRSTGKRSYWTTETDYFIDTDRGLIRDEGSLWNLDLEGDEYNEVEEGKNYDFVVSHDKLTGQDDALEVKVAAPVASPAPAGPSW